MKYITTNKLKSSVAMSGPKGFTLIEVIVVVIVVGILSLVSIKLYSGYITETRQETVNNLAETAATAANAFWRKTNTDPVLANLSLMMNSTKFNVNINNNNVTVSWTNYATINATVGYK